MREVICMLLLCFSAGGILLTGAVLDWRISQLQYLSCFKWGRIGSRLFTAGFGALLIGIGIMLVLAL